MSVGHVGGTVRVEHVLTCTKDDNIVFGRDLVHDYDTEKKQEVPNSAGEVEAATARWIKVGEQSNNGSRGDRD